jgi:hypothetical protein
MTNLNGSDLGGLKASELRIVTLCFYDCSPTTHFVRECDVEKLVQASLKLHYKPGINPYNGVETARLYRILVAPLRIDGPFWWSTPNLENNEDPSGARIIQGGVDSVAWKDPDYKG